MVVCMSLAVALRLQTLMVLPTVGGGGPTVSMRGWCVSTMNLLPCSQTSSRGSPGPVHCKHGCEHCGMGTYVQGHYPTWCSGEDLTRLNSIMKSHTRFAEESMHQRRIDGSM